MLRGSPLSTARHSTPISTGRHRPGRFECWSCESPTVTPGRGLTTGEIAAHFDEVYRAKVGKDTIPRIADKALEEMSE